MRISTLTGKESRAFNVRRIVLGCLSRDGGARGEVRGVMSREERREEREWEWSVRGRGTEDKEGRERRDEREGRGGGRKERGVGNEDREVLEDNRHAGYIRSASSPASLSLLALYLSNSPPIQLPQRTFPLNALRFFRSRSFGTCCDTEKVVLSGFSIPVETFCVNRADSYHTNCSYPTLNAHHRPVPHLHQIFHSSQELTLAVYFLSKFLT